MLKEPKKFGLCILAIGALLLAGCARVPKKSISVRDWPNAAPLPASTEKKIEGLSHYAAGLSHEFNDRPEEATREFTRAALADLKNEQLVLEVARRLIREEKAAEAINLLRRAARGGTASGHIYSWLGLAYAQTGATNLAIKANQSAIARAPDEFLAYQNLVQVLLQANRTNEIRNLMQKAAQVTEAAPEFYLGAAELLGRLNRSAVFSDEESKELSLKLLSSAVGKDAANPLILARLAEMFLAHGQTGKAEALLADLYAKHPEIPGLRERLANIYIRTEQREKAQQLLEDLRRANPTNPLNYFLLGSLAYERSDYEKAAEHLATALRLNPDFEPGYYELAGVHIARQKPEEALKVLDQARAKFKLNFTLEFYSGVARAMQEKFSEAISHLISAELLAKTAEPHRLTHQFYFQLGSTYERSGNIPEAEKALRRCLELDPNNADAMNYLGYMWADLNMNLEEAKDLIERAVQQEPNNAAFLDSLGWVLFRLNRPEEALHYLQQAVANSETPDPTLFDHLGDIYAALQKIQEAKEAYTQALALKADQKIRSKLEQLP